MSENTEIDANEMARMYEGGKSSTAIGKVMGVSGKTVLKRLREVGVAIRPSPFHGDGISHDKDGYVLIYRPGHPRASKRDGYVRQSIISWEDAHGVPFPDGKEPHHKDLDPSNDSPENIQPVTRREHNQLHARARLRGEGGRFVKSRGGQQ